LDVAVSITVMTCLRDAQSAVSIVGRCDEGRAVVTLSGDEGPYASMDAGEGVLQNEHMCDMLCSTISYGNMEKKSC
jgi:hypothetical protein